MEGIIVILVLISLAGLVLAVATARKERPIRHGFGVARIALGLAAIFVLAAITGVTTPPALAAGAAVIGLFFGWMQRQNTGLREREGRRLFRRSVPGAVLFSLGLIGMQLAGFGSRTGLLRLGHTLAILSVATAIGLVAGRWPRERLRTLAPSSVALLCAVVVAGSGLIDVAAVDAQESGAWKRDGGRVVGTDFYPGVSGSAGPEGATVTRTVAPFTPTDVFAVATTNVTWKAPPPIMPPVQSVDLRASVTLGKTWFGLDAHFNFFVQALATLDGADVVTGGDTPVGTDYGIGVSCSEYKCVAEGSGFSVASLSIPAGTVKGETRVFQWRVQNAGSALRYEWIYTWDPDLDPDPDPDPDPTGMFGALTPARLLESRVGPNLETVDGRFEGIGRRSRGQVTELVVAGRAGVPGNAGAVSLNTTIVNPDGGGYATLWPCGVNRPTTSSVNYAAGDIVGNSAIVKVGTGGKVCLYTSQGTDVVIDTTGYFPAGTFGALTPARLFESRLGPNLDTVDGRFEGIGRRSRGQVTELVVAGRAGVPGNAGAVSLNTTIVNPDGGGYATLWPCGVNRPTTSSVNYAAGDIVGNSAIVKVGTGGKVCLYTSQGTDVVIDTTGYFPAGTFGALTPARLFESRLGPNLDTVDGRFEGIGRRSRGQVTELVVAGRAGVPGNAGAVSLNTTIVNPDGGGYATLWPCGVNRPTTSSVNFAAGDIVGNSAIVKVGTGGKVCLYTSQSTDVVIDTTGYFG